MSKNRLTTHTYHTFGEVDSASTALAEQHFRIFGFVYKQQTFSVQTAVLASVGRLVEAASRERKWFGHLPYSSSLSSFSSSIYQQ